MNHTFNAILVRLGIDPSGNPEKHLRDAIWLVSSQVLTLGLSFASMKLTTSMGPVEYGRLALGISVFNFAVMFIYNPLEQSFSRFYFDYRMKGEHKQYLTIIFRVLGSSFAGLLILALMVMIGWLFLRGSEASPFFYSVVIMYALLAAASVPLQTLINLMQQRAVFAAMNTLEKAGQVLLMVLLWSVALLRADTVLSVYALLASCTLTWRLLFISRKSRYTLSDALRIGTRSSESIRSGMRTMLGFSGPILVLGAMGWIQMNSERWVIKTLMSPLEVGIYAFMMTTSFTLITVIVTALTQLANPVIYRRFADLRDEKTVVQGLRYLYIFTAVIGCISAVACGALWLGSETVVLLLSNRAFLPYAGLLPIVFAYAALFNLGQTLCSVGFLLKQNEIYIVPKLLIGALTVAGYAYGAAYFGLFGMAIIAMVLSIVFVGLIAAANVYILRRWRAGMRLIV